MRLNEESETLLIANKAGEQTSFRLFESKESLSLSFLLFI